MAERLHRFPNRLRTLNAVETQQLVATNNLVPAGTDPAHERQILRMIDYLAGNVGSILVTYPTIDDLDISKAKVVLSAARQDERELADILGSGVTPLFRPEQPAISYPLLVRPDTQLIVADGRILFSGKTIENETNAASLFLPALAQATGLNRDQILHIARTVQDERKGSIAQQMPEAETEADELIEAEAAALKPSIKQSEAATITSSFSYTALAEGIEELLASERVDYFFPHQQDMLHAIATATQAGDTRVGIYSATGSGKTRVIAETAKLARQPTLIVVPTQIVLEQTMRELEQAGVSAGRYFEGEKSSFNDAQVIVTTYASFARENFPFRSNEVGLVLLDEAHLSAGEKTSRTLERFAGALQIAFTASPDFSSHSSIREQFPTAYEIGARDLAEQGYLSPFGVWIAKTKLDITDISISPTGDYNERELAAAVQKAGFSTAAVDLYLGQFQAKDGKPAKSAIAYCVGVEHARQTAELFRQRGINAEYISGQTPTEQRTEILARFRSGDIQVLCNAEVLTLGFDEPRAEVCLNLRPTHSLVTAIQRAGRILRLDMQNEEKFAIIVDFLPARTRAERMPISYADIVGAALVMPITGEGKTSQRRTERRSISHPSIFHPSVQSFILNNDIQIVTDVAEVMKIVQERSPFVLPKPTDLILSKLEEEVSMDLRGTKGRVRLERFIKEFLALSGNESLTRGDIVFRARYVVPGQVSSRLLEHYRGDFVQWLKKQHVMAVQAARREAALTPDQHISSFIQNLSSFLQHEDAAPIESKTLSAKQRETLIAIRDALAAGDRHIDIQNPIGEESFPLLAALGEAYGDPRGMMLLLSRDHLGIILNDQVSTPSLMRLRALKAKHVRVDQFKYLGAREITQPQNFNFFIFDESETNDHDNTHGEEFAHAITIRLTAHIPRSVVARRLAEEMHIDADTLIKRITDPAFRQAFCLTYPDIDPVTLSQEFPSPPKGRPALFLRPEFADYVRVQLAKRPRHPATWITLTDVVKMPIEGTTTNLEIVREVARQLLDRWLSDVDNAEQEKERLTGRYSDDRLTNEAQYYSPEFIARLVEAITQLKRNR